MKKRFMKSAIAIILVMIAVFLFQCCHAATLEICFIYKR